MDLLPRERGLNRRPQVADKDTVFPYDDEVADPYAADDTKNPHEATEGNGNGADEKPAPKRASRTSKTVKKT